MTYSKTTSSASRSKKIGRDTSELQSRRELVCRLLLEKKKYWTGTNTLDFDTGPKGALKVFPSIMLENAQGGTVILKLTDVSFFTDSAPILMSTPSLHCALPI